MAQKPAILGPESYETFGGKELNEETSPQADTLSNKKHYTAKYVLEH